MKLSAVGLLGVAFVIMKLMGYITWSWWWVTLPFWGGPALIIGLPLLIYGLAYIGDAVINGIRKYKKYKKSL